MSGYVVPTFPYAALVRIPLLTLTPLAALLLARKLGFDLLYFVPHEWQERTLAAVILLFAIGALIQIIAIPFGIIALRRTRIKYSPHYSLAIFCGVADLALLSLGLLRGSIVT